MKTLLAAACLSTFAVGAAWAESRGITPSFTIGGSVFADLTALGFDLGKFEPAFSGRFPYRI